MNCHIINIDNILINFNQSVWVIDKSKPNKCLFKIPKSDFDLIKSGIYTNNNKSILFGGKKYYVNDEFIDKLNSFNIESEQLTFSFREFTDPSILDKSQIEYDLSPIKHLKNTLDDVFFVSTKKTPKYDTYIENLKDKLNEIGINVKQTYYLNSSYFAQSSDSNIMKLCNVVISNMIGKNLNDGKFNEENGRDYEDIFYYDSNYVNINKLDIQLKDFITYYDIEKEELKDVYLVQVGSNEMNKLNYKKVKLKEKYILEVERNILKYNDYKLILEQEEEEEVDNIEDEDEIDVGKESEDLPYIVSSAITDIELKVAKMFEPSEDDPSYYDLGLELLDVNKTDMPSNKMLIVKYQDENFIYQVIFIVPNNIDNMEDGEINQCIIKFKKYNLENNIVGQIKRSDVPIEDIDQDLIDSLNAEVDEKYSIVVDDFEMKFEK